MTSTLHVTLLLGMNCLYFLCTQRCWLVYTFQIRKNGRRDITRRYFLGNMQSEERSINFKKELVYIFYVHNVVDECTYFTYTELGGRIHRTSRYGCACNIIQFINKKEPALMYCPLKSGHGNKGAF